MVKVPRLRSEKELNVGGAFGAPDAPHVNAPGPISVPYQSRGDAMGQVLQSFGAAVRSFGGALADEQTRQQATMDASWFAKARAETGVYWNQRSIELQKEAGAPVSDPGAGLSAPGVPGQSYAALAQKEWESYVAGIAKAAPNERAKRAYLDWAAGAGAAARTDAIEFEEASLFKQRISDFNSALNAHTQAVFADPSRYDEVLADARDDLDAAAAWMTPEQEVAAREKVETDLQLARAKRLATSAPLKFQEEVGLAVGPINTTAAKIIGVESRGNATASNPRSSASGLGQFTDSTWLVTVRKHRPDLAGLSDRELIALKTDAKLAQEMTIRHTEDNARALTASGLPTTEANLYLAHFAGIEGARRVLGAPDDATVLDVLGAQVVRANPFLRGMTVKDLKVWAAAKMSGAEPASLGSYVDNPKYSRLTPDQIFALAHDADSAVVRQHNAAVAEQQAVYGVRFNTLMTAIMDGDAGLADVQNARREGWLADYGDISKAMKAIEDRDKEALNTARAVARVAGGGLNPYLEKDRDDIDLAYKALGGATDLSNGDAGSVTRLRQVVEKTDVVPASAIAALRAGMGSRRPDEMMKSFQVLDGLYRAYPGAVTRAFSEDDLKRLQDYQALVETTPPEELAGRMDINSDPTRRKLRDELIAEGAKLAAEVDDAEILSVFNPGAIPNVLNWSYAPGMPLDPKAQVQLRQDFDRLFAERYAVSRDVDTAKHQAFDALQRKWGVTDAGDAPRLIAYPPERYYPKVDDSHDWMADQLAATVEDQFPGAQDWSIVTTAETEAEVTLGKPPSYQVLVIDADGSFRVLGAFYFNDEAAQDEVRARFEEDRRRVLEPPQRMPELQGMPKDPLGVGVQ